MSRKALPLTQLTARQLLSRAQRNEKLLTQYKKAFDDSFERFNVQAKQLADARRELSETVQIASRARADQVADKQRIDALKVMLKDHQEAAANAQNDAKAAEAFGREMAIKHKAMVDLVVKLAGKLP